VGLLLLSNSSLTIVADASAIINLNATQCAADILRSLPERVAVVDIVAGELEEGRAKGRPDAEMLADLAASGLVEIVRLGDTGEALFERLVIGPASSTLDDGEAATIAYAVERTLAVVVDDNKARRICQEQFPAVGRRCSCDIFRHPAICKSLGKERLALAVLNALQLARMRVLTEHLEWVVDLIGPEKARTCHSLPQALRQCASRCGRRI
jgi:predicted nucleic acid-binding protein